MSKFLLTTSARDIAGQIADLLNMGGQLWAYITADTILRNQVKYLIEMDADVVTGIMGLEVFGTVTEMKHLCVNPDYRRRGLGKKLLEKGIEATQTEFIYGTVRLDNETNIRNNLRVGMKPIGKKLGRGCYIIIFARRKHERHGYIIHR